MTIAFVTGGSGFLGRFVIRRLVDQGHRVVALARSEAAARTLTALGAAPVQGDLDDPDSFEAAMSASSAEVLVNLASLGFGHAPLIVHTTSRCGLRRAVFVSTTAIFTGLAASTKGTRVEAEAVIRGTDLEWTIVRPTMIYGACGDRNMERLLWALAKSPVVPVPGGGRRLQQPVHVEDLAGAITTVAAKREAVGCAYDLAGPEPLTLRDAILEAGRAIGRSPRLVPVPLRATVAALHAYERLAPRPRIRAEQVERLAEDKAFDITAACTELGYSPRPFAAGIGEEARALGLAPRPAAIARAPGAAS
jgi:nucleoside-diphosphate-sugar epimerase